MWWVVAIIAFVAVIGFLEWRSRNKPLASGFRDHVGLHSTTDNAGLRWMTGGHDADKRG